MHVAADLQASSELLRISSYSLAALTRRLGRADWPILILLDVLVVAFWIQILRKRGPLDAVFSMPVAAILINPHVFVYDLTVCLAAVPALVRRPLKWSLPFLVVGSLFPWVGHLAWRDSTVVVLDLALALMFVLGVAPDNRRPPTRFGAVCVFHEA